jgi:GAF domain-containing protein
MKKAPIPQNEKERLLSVYALELLDTPPEERFDLFTRVATKIFEVPISILTLVDANREWFKSCQGLPNHEGDRAISFCGHALLENEILVIPDAKKDPRFSDNPMVTGAPYIRFYAGVPILSGDGQRVGTFCIKDTKPREFTQEDRSALRQLALLVEHEVNLRNTP